jgi:hypothetical protein
MLDHHRHRYDHLLVLGSGVLAHHFGIVSLSFSLREATHMPTRKRKRPSPVKRQYVKDLIKVATRDIKQSIKEWDGNKAYAFGDQDGCPIATSLQRHGHEAHFDGFSFVIIDGETYKVPPSMVKWQRGGVSGRRRTLPFSFRISDLKQTVD